MSNQATMFWSRVKFDVSTGCKNWTGGVHKCGFGQFRFLNAMTLTHQVAWKLEKKELPEGHYLLHTCGNKLCCNVEHMRLEVIPDAPPVMAPSRQGQVKFTAAEVYQIRWLFSHGVGTQEVIGNMFGTSKQTIANIVDNDSWKTLVVEEEKQGA